MNLRNFFSELKRRNVVRIAGLYLVGAWLIVQVASTVPPMFGAPDWLPRTIVSLLAIGFIPALIFSWVFELTPQGLKRDEDVKPDESIAPQTGRRMDRLIIVVLVLALAYFAFDKFVLTPRHTASLPNEHRTSSSSTSIAVLPFVNMSADKNDEYLSDGMTEELINVLAKVPGLRVPGRTSCFAFKGKNEEDIFRKVGDQLHVGTVLEGSVRKAGDKLRVTAQLINVSDGYHLWSKDYDGDVKDILNFQSNVAEQVVQALQVQLGTEAARALSKKPTENAEAYRLYLLGRYHFAKFTRVGWTKAIQYFQQALQIDPSYALAYCGLADTYGWAGGQTLSGREAWTKEMEYAEKALALDPNLAEAHLAMGTALFSVLNPHASEKELDRAVELNPNLALAYDQYGWTFAEMGRHDESIAAENRALELDPLNSLFNTDLAFFLYWARRYDDAIAQVRKTLELDPNTVLAHHCVGWCMVLKGNLNEAKTEFQKAAALDDLPWYKADLGYAYGASGDRAKAEQVLRDLDELAKKQYVSPALHASVYLGLGEKAKALDWIEKAYEDRDPMLWWTTDQLYDSVRNEPRFQAVIQKVNALKEGAKK
jgi:serine/threonine-protein kinase